MTPIWRRSSAPPSRLRFARKTVELAWRELQLLIRHRRDLVFKSSAVATQIREHLEAALPGYAACFDKLWESATAWTLVHHFDSARPSTRPAW